MEMNREGTSTTPLKLWRSLEDLGGERKRTRLPLPPHLAAALDPINRQQFLKLMGASLALAGLTACGNEPKGPTQLVPYVRRPEEIVQGESLFFATALTHQGYANGVVVRSYAGRPIKVEGNPRHPGSLGATTIFGQAAMHDFYDPDRSTVVRSRGQIATWEDFVAAASAVVQTQRSNGGLGLRILTETVTSPSLDDEFQALARTFPRAQWHAWEPLNRDNVYAGAGLAFGQPVEPQYRLDRAAVVVCLDADLLNGLPGSLRYAHDFAAQRRVTTSRPTQNRLYAVESTPSVTGMVAARADVVTAHSSAPPRMARRR